MPPFISLQSFHMAWNSLVWRGNGRVREPKILINRLNMNLIRFWWQFITRMYRNRCSALQFAKRMFFESELSVCERYLSPSFASDTHACLSYLSSLRTYRMCVMRRAWLFFFFFFFRLPHRITNSMFFAFVCCVFLLRTSTEDVINKQKAKIWKRKKYRVVLR